MSFTEANVVRIQFNALHLGGQKIDGDFDVLLFREQTLFTEQQDVEVAVDLLAPEVQRVELYADDVRLGEAHEPPFVVRIAALPWNYSTDNLRALVVRPGGN